MSEAAGQMAAAEGSSVRRHVERRGETRRRRRRQRTAPPPQPTSPAPPPRAAKLTPARLAEAIGAEVAAALMRRFGGRTIPTLSPEREKVRQRHAEVRERAAKDGYGAAASQFNLSIRQVRRIVHGY